jgi:hypothetical protein
MSRYLKIEMERIHLAAESRLLCIAKLQVWQASNARSQPIDRGAQCGRILEFVSADSSNNASAPVGDDGSRHFGHSEGAKQRSRLIERQGYLDTLLASILAQIFGRCPKTRSDSEPANAAVGRQFLHLLAHVTAV